MLSCPSGSPDAPLGPLRGHPPSTRPSLLLTGENAWGGGGQRAYSEALCRLCFFFFYLPVDALPAPLAAMVTDPVTDLLVRRLHMRIGRTMGRAEMRKKEFTKQGAFRVKTQGTLKCLILLQGVDVLLEVLSRDLLGPQVKELLQWKVLPHIVHIHALQLFLCVGKPHI